MPLGSPRGNGVSQGVLAWALKLRMPGPRRPPLQGAPGVRAGHLGSGGCEETRENLVSRPESTRRPAEGDTRGRCSVRVNHWALAEDRGCRAGGVWATGVTRRLDPLLRVLSEMQLPSPEEGGSNSGNPSVLPQPCIHLCLKSQCDSRLLKNTYLMVAQSEAERVFFSFFK